MYLPRATPVVWPGLFAYPLIAEPLITLDAQTRAWGVGRFVLMVMLGVTGQA